MATIALTLDGSSLAQIALPHALSRLRKDDELLLVCVAPTQPEEKAALEALEHVAASLAEHASRISTVVRSGPPAQEILDVLESRQADLLVISSHGHSGWQRARLGSVAEEVTRRCPCPVWLVRAQHKQAPVLETVIAALDGTAHGETALEFVQEWLEQPRRLILFGATDLITDLSKSLGSREEARAAALRDTQAYLEERAHWLRDRGRPCEVQVADATAAQAIVHAAEAEGADLVVVGTHGRSGPLRWLLGSVAESVMRESPCPVAVISPEATWSRRG